MKKFPTFFVIIDVIAGILWKFGAKAGTMVKDAGSKIYLGVGKINVLKPLSAIVESLGSLLKFVGAIGKIVFIISIIITIILLIRFIVGKIKYKKMMKKVENMPESGQAYIAPAGGQPAQSGAPVSGGPREINGF